MPDPAPERRTQTPSTWADKHLLDIIRGAEKFGSPFVLDSPRHSGAVLVVKHYGSGARELPLYVSDPVRLDHYLTHQD